MMRDGMTKLSQDGAYTRLGKLLGRREVPETGHVPEGALAAPQQNPARPLHYQQGFAQLHWLHAAQFYRQLAGGAGAPRLASGRDRTRPAKRIARQTHGGAQLHESLVEAARIARYQPGLRGFGETAAGGHCADVGGVAQDPRHYPKHVAIHGRVRRPKAMLATAAAV